MVARDGGIGSMRVIDGPRPATPSDLDAVIALVDATLRAGSDQSMRTDYPLVYRRGNLHNVRVLRVDGELVSVVPVLPRHIRLGTVELELGVISPTATDPAHRHRGYASRCLASCIDAMRAEGCALSVLWTLVETFPFYERAGYHPVRGQAFTYRLDPSDASRFPRDPGVVVTVLEYGDTASLETIRDLHEHDGDGDGIRRTRSEYPALLSLPRMHTLLATRGRRLAGYLVVSRAINKPGLLEAGGDPAAIETLVNEALVRMDAGTALDAPGTLATSGLSTVLDRRVASRRTAVLDGMMIRINDLPAVLRAVARPAAGGSATPDIELAEDAWTPALFGSHVARPFMPPAGLAERLGISLPIPFPIPVLDRS
jgi:predicted N-acetyltransferase YhbS